MKKYLSLLLCALLLAGCSQTGADVTHPEAAVPVATLPQPVLEEPHPFQSRFDTEAVILLSDDGVSVNGGGETEAVFTSHDIIFYENRDTYSSGNPYGEGEVHERHSTEKAAAHTVVNITAPGTYRVSGKLSAGQIRVDLGYTAYDDPNAVVELILDNVDITCTVAPAILFLNTYECDNKWSAETASPEVDTTAAGANLILSGKNIVAGSHVAKIFKDKEGEKKQWKQDGTIYSYMSLNVWGDGSLDLRADNEGLDTELHLTIWGGDISIRADNDGINTNEDGVSVTTIHGGSLHIVAGLGEEGDGIDSNGYLVINGGTVVASANPAADAGMDSDLGSYINGGTVIALGSTMDWAESASGQVTMNLQFARHQSAGSAISVTDAAGVVVFAYDPGMDEHLGEAPRQFQGAILSCPYLVQGEPYHVWLNGTLTGTEAGGIYDVLTGVTLVGGTQLAYSGSDVGFGGGRGMNGGKPGQMPAGMEPPEGFSGSSPEGMEPPEGFFGEKPEAFRDERPEGDIPTMPEGLAPSDNFEGKYPGNKEDAEISTAFVMVDMVNSFSGVIEA